ncbi:MAG: exopolyphosphatase, partial [Candidatus Nanopelagicales bacterium]
RHLTGDPASLAQIAAAELDIAAGFERARAAVRLQDARTVVGVAGTVTTISAMAMGLQAYDPGVIHGSSLTPDEIEALTAELLAMPRAQRAQLPFMHPGRVDVIGGGAMILRELVRRTHPARILVSEYDILDGIVYRLAAAAS